MANPYLIQALYGPKPTPPANGNNRPDNGKPITVSASAPALTLRTLSLSDKLYGRATDTDIHADKQIHPDRRDGYEFNEVTEDPNEVAKPWTPTGPNILPVGPKAFDTNGSVLLPSLSKPPLASVKSAKPGARLKFPLERYLPPPGPYYDQFTIASLLAIKFTGNRCWTCWDFQSACTQRGTCTKVCKICGTSNHPGKTCPSLYCTFSWFKDRNVNLTMIKDVARQFRPSPSEYAVLLEHGLVKDSGKHSLPIVPNMAHPLVKTFYHKKPASRVMQRQLTSDSSETTIGNGRDILMRKDSLRMIPAKTSNQINASFDPRLQGKFAYTTSMATSISTNNTAVERKVVSYDTVAPSHDVNKRAEDKLQELEDEILRLKIDNVLKDREIRRLKSEIAKLSGDDYETGSKRPCI